MENETKRNEVSNEVVGTKYYHYTIKPYLKTIIEEGKIRQGKSRIKKVKPITWVSTNQLMENTSLKGAVCTSTGKNLGTMSFESQHEAVGCVRIQVDPSVLTKWSVLKHKAGYHTLSKRFGYDLAQQLDTEGLEVGARPSEWYGSLNPITEDKFLSIEVWNGSEWVEDETYWSLKISA